MNKQMNISVLSCLDFYKILNELVENESSTAQLGDIIIRYIGTKEDTARGKREIFEIERLCK